jgi:hypothetical protein
MDGNRTLAGPEANTRAMLLSWFGEDELSVCPDCGNRHVLPPWGSARGEFCATCGLLGIGTDGSNGGGER